MNNLKNAEMLKLNITNFFTKLVVMGREIFFCSQAKKALTHGCTWKLNHFYNSSHCEETQVISLSFRDRHVIQVYDSNNAKVFQDWLHKLVQRAASNGIKITDKSQVSHSQPPNKLMCINTHWLIWYTHLPTLCAASGYAHSVQPLTQAHTLLLSLWYLHWPLNIIYQQRVAFQHKHPP